MAFKRVRFQEPEEDIERSTSFLKLKKRRTTQRTLLPGHEHEDDELEGELTEGYRGMADVEDLLWDDEPDQGPVKAVNPERAAAKRAARRKDFAKLTRAEGGGLLDDISAAEAEYEAREGFWDNSGVPIEPFHLRQEREAGFFDDEGNYVAFKDGPEDAWLESLPKGVDPQENGAESAMQEEAQQAAQEAEQAEPLSDGALRCYKEGLVDLLRPGETVLSALRRMGNLQGTSKQVVKLAERERMRKGRTVPLENRDAFNRLTEFSHILLEHGDYHVHSGRKEQLQHDLHLSVSGIRAGIEPHSDPANEQSWKNFAARLSIPTQPLVSQQAAAGHGKGTSEQARSEANIVRTVFPADPDEDIFAAAQPVQGHSSSAQQQTGTTASLADVGQMPDGEDATPDQLYPGMEDAAWSHSQPMHAAAADPMRLLEEQSLAAAAPFEEPFQDSIMEARLSDDEEALSEPGAPHQDTRSAGAGRPSPSAPASGVPSSTHYSSPQGDTPSDEQQDTGESGGPSEMVGFQYDHSSGFLYNSAMGAFYDVEKGLFGDAASGQWYSLQDGNYRLVS